MNTLLQQHRYPSGRPLFGLCSLDLRFGGSDVRWCQPTKPFSEEEF